MDYQVVFDAAQESYQWWIPGIGLIPLLVGLYVWKRRKSLAKLAASFDWRKGDTVGQWSTIAALVAIQLLIVGPCVSLIIFNTTYANYTEIEAAIRESKLNVIEGPIQNFKPESRLAYGPESFSIQNVLFEYLSSEVSYGFHKVSRDGGPINKNGQMVRIHYLVDSATGRNTIVKLELRR